MLMLKMETPRIMHSASVQVVASGESLICELDLQEEKFAKRILVYITSLGHVSFYTRRTRPRIFFTSLAGLLPNTTSQLLSLTTAEQVEVQNVRGSPAIWNEG